MGKSKLSGTAGTSLAEPMKTAIESQPLSAAIAATRDTRALPTQVHPLSYLVPTLADGLWRLRHKTGNGGDVGAETLQNLGVRVTS